MKAAERIKRVGRWTSPHEYLWWKAGVLQKSDLIGILRNLSKHLDADKIQDLLQYEMEIDGYFQ